MIDFNAIMQAVCPIGPQYLGTFPVHHMWRLYNICAKLPNNPMIVEVGTKYGRSATTLSLSRPDATVLTIDVKNWEPGKILGQNVIKLIMSSIDAAKIVDVAIDFLWIDGHHYRESVIADIRAWTPMLKPGGYVAFHDYNNNLGKCAVKAAVDKMITEPEYELLDHEKWNGRRIVAARRK